jgi:hypothetical protein
MGKINASSRVRTYDLTVNSRVLCQLSRETKVSPTTPSFVENYDPTLC